MNKHALLLTLLIAAACGPKPLDHPITFTLENGLDHDIFADSGCDADWITVKDKSGTEISLYTVSCNQCGIGIHESCPLGLRAEAASRCASLASPLAAKADLTTTWNGLSSRLNGSCYEEFAAEGDLTATFCWGHMVMSEQDPMITDKTCTDQTFRVGRDFDVRATAN